MAYTQTFDKLTIASLTREMHEQTCGYWYVIQNRFGPHTAFRTKVQTLRWLENMGLSIAQELPEPGTHSYQPIIGAYRRTSHTLIDDFNALSGKAIPCLDNGSYTRGIITTDADGLRTLHHLNCNVEREQFDYRLTHTQDEIA